MTEAEWLSSADGPAMAKFWGERFSERKGRLLMLACCRRRAQHLIEPVLREAVESLAAHYADPCAPDEPFDRDEYLARYDCLDERGVAGWPDAVHHAASAVEAATEPVRALVRDSDTLDWAVWSCLCDAATAGNDGEERFIPGEPEAQAVLVREIVGNPIRPVAFAPAWRTDTALALARQMYAAEDFGAAPILADALQDAGCDSDDLLNHLRNGEAAHVRGCWAVDLVMGKE